MYTNDPLVKPIDAHAHLPLQQRSHPICLASCQPAEWEIVKKKDVFSKGFGHHPWFVDKAWEPSRLEKILMDNPKSFGEQKYLLEFLKNFFENQKTKYVHEIEILIELKK